MKTKIYALIVGCTALVMLSACGGGGGGGAAPKVTKKIYIFGNLSTNYSIAGVTSTLSVPGFVDYSSSASDQNNTSSLRSGVIQATGQGVGWMAGGSYNKTSKMLTLTLTNSSFNTTSINGATGTEIATIQAAGGTAIPLSDATPYVSQFKLTGAPNPPNGDLNGCSVIYGP